MNLELVIQSIVSANYSPCSEYAKWPHAAWSLSVLNIKIVWSSYVTSSTSVVLGIQRIECNITWANRIGVAVTVATFYQQYKTVDECLAGCVYQSSGCVAAQIINNTIPMKCFLVTDANSVYAAVPTPGVVLYVIKKTCGSNSGTYGASRTILSIRASGVACSLNHKPAYIEQRWFVNLQFRHRKIFTMLFLLLLIFGLCWYSF